MANEDISKDATVEELQQSAEASMFSVPSFGNAMYLSIREEDAEEIVTKDDPETENVNEETKRTVLYALYKESHQCLHLAVTEQKARFLRLQQKISR